MLVSRWVFVLIIYYFMNLLLWMINSPNSWVIRDLKLWNRIHKSSGVTVSASRTINGSLFWCHSSRNSESFCSSGSVRTGFLIFTFNVCHKKVKFDVQHTNTNNVRRWRMSFQHTLKSQLLTVVTAYLKPYLSDGSHKPTLVSVFYVLK